MSPDQLEFAITQYLDGTLPPEDVAALEQKLATEPEAQALLEEHRSLTAMLRADPAPALAWDEVASDLQAVVTGTVDHQARAQDQKLNGLLKSAVAPLPAVRWDALAATISASVDREVAFRDEQDDALDNALRALLTPSLNWDRLAAHLSSAVAKQAGQAEEQPIRERVYSLKWVRRATQLAMAACITVAAAIGIRAYLRQDTSRDIAIVPVTPTPVAKVDVAGPEKATATAVAQISIGPSAEYTRLLEQDESFSRGIASARSPIVIALPVSVSDDTDRAYGMFE